MEGRRKIKLFCPSVSMILDWVVWNDQKLDFGLIAAAFGLEPLSVKLNGYFISRDIDLISSCVTWQSLLAFFSDKGLFTGKDDDQPVLVHGKLSHVGTKRAHFDHPENLIKRKKLEDKCSETFMSESNKRKLVSEDSKSLKKLKFNMGNNTFGEIPDFPVKQVGVRRSSSPLKCSFMSSGLKRTSENDMIGSASCKKLRLEETM